MRLATAHAYDTSIGALQKRQEQLTELQMKLTSGKRVERASDDPAAAARAERALATEKRAEATQRALDASLNSMTLTESKLADAGDLLQQARETLLAAGNASYSDAERKSAAETLKNIRSQLLAIANANDGAGTYLFGGEGAVNAPFVDDNLTGVRYNAPAQGEMASASAEALPLSVNGNAAWLMAPSGNGVFETQGNAANTGTAWIDAGRVTDPSDAGIGATTFRIQFAVDGAGVTTYSITRDDGVDPGIAGVPYVAGKAITVNGMAVGITGKPADGDQFAIAPSTPSANIFATLDRAVTALTTPGLNGGQIAQAVQSGIRDVDASSGALQTLRSRVGEVLNRIDSASGRNADLKVYAAGEREAAEGLDMVSALSEFSNKQTGYDAALKAYSMVQKLSLFDYLNV